MADRSRRDPDDPDAPDFDWLYGSKRTGGQDVGAPPGADDPTQVQRSRSRRGEPDDHPPRDPEPTRMLPTVERPGSGPSARTSTRRPYQAPPPTRPPEDGWAEPVAPSGPSRQQPMGAPPTGRPRGRRRFRLGWLKLVLLLWVVFLVAVPLIAWSKIEKVDATPSGARPASQPGTTYLLVGSDSREGLTRKQEREFGTGKGAGRRTDTIMLLHTGSGPNLLMSIPRDSLVDVPGHGTTKINSAFAFGGPPLLVRTIEQATGIRVDNYIEIGFSGFVGVVDAVNGIKICPKRAMKDRLANLDIKKGCQDVDGKVALGYARSRHTSGLGDIARAQHQREVVSAVGAKAASPWSILNPVRYYRLAMAGSDSLRVGEDTGMIATLRFAWAMTRVNGSNGLTCGVPISDLAVHWDPERARRLFRLIKQDRTSDIPKRLCRPSGLRG
ncbi:MAG TPA: LCP family protein [Nocardioidaceae bacterium]|nr:LCP family protein [Nocardioidaceae bacterium]